MGNNVKEKGLMFILGLSILFICSCGDKNDFSFDKLSTKIETTSEIVVPLINADVTIEELLPETSVTNRFLEIGPDNFIKLIYEDTIATITAFDMFKGDYSGVSLAPNSHDADAQSVVLNMDKLLRQGRIYFADPKMTISIKNYWNVAANFRFREFQYLTEEGAQANAVEGTAIDAVYSIQQPGANEFAVTEITLDRTNSNIDSVISALPYSISAGASIEIPGGEPYDIDENTTDTVKLKVEMPLELLIEDIIHKDTMNFTLFNDYEDDAEAIEFLNLNLLANNGFPIDLLTQIYFAEENGFIIDSVSATGINILAGNSKDQTNIPVETKTIIELDKTKIASATKAKKLILKVTINTRDANLDQTVKLYSNYSVGIRLGARTKLKLRTK